ncbi:MAG TPA: glutamate mutase L, partial [Candidatus Binatia bacterium]|nr:glutamate mutase L [Candidatus Binatia bacterium]
TGEDGWGDLLVVDVGGATTDVHSIGYGEASGPQLSDQGLPEAFAKRTVEGDLGIRFNAGTLLERVGIERFYSTFQQAFPQTHVSQCDITEYIGNLTRDTATVPQTKWQSAVDAELAHIAADIAIERHVGKKERIVAREGEAWIYYGKDLSETRTVIGTGGVFIYNPNAAHVLRPAAGGDGRYEVLRPKCPKLFIDEHYLLYAVGLLARTRPDVALKMFKKYMHPLPA